MLMQFLCEFYADGLLDKVLDKGPTFSKATIDGANLQVNMILPKHITGIRRTKSYVLSLI